MTLIHLWDAVVLFAAIPVFVVAIPVIVWVTQVAIDGATGVLRRIVDAPAKRQKLRTSHRLRIPLNGDML